MEHDGTTFNPPKPTLGTTVHTVTDAQRDRQTDDSVMPIANHTVKQGSARNILSADLISQFTAMHCSAAKLTLFQECDNGEKNVVSSSYVWVCMTGHGGTEVSVADANDLGSVLNKFHVSSSHILCITGVPGDY